MNEAQVICRQLGYGPAINAPGYATYGPGVGPIHLVHVHCNGSESSILDCTSYYSEHCSHSEDAGVECSAPVRLVNGSSSNEGQVEVFYQGEWGTVCDDGWDLNNADVVCRMLGYPSASNAWSGAHFGQGSGPIMLDNVNCQGYESSIAECNHAGWFSHNCGHNEDAGVTCNSDSTTEPPYSGCSSYEWQCYYNGQCIQDYQRCNGYTDCYFGEDESNCYDYTTEPSNSGCSSNEWACYYYGQCIQDYQRCNTTLPNHWMCISNHFFHSSCFIGNTVAPTVDVNPPSSVIRLVNGSTIYEGRVEVFVNGSWGTACSHSWDMNEAQVICRQLGYGPAINATGYATYGPGVGPIHLVHVHCNGSESSILDCTSDYSEHCSHSEDAGVECSAPVRLVNGSSSNEGQVEVFYQGEWGTVCDDGWDLNNADVVCRMLGYPSASNAWSSAHFGQGSGPIMLDNVNCQGYESSIAECNHAGWFSHNCGHNEDAGVTCNSDGQPWITGDPLTTTNPGERIVLILNGSETLQITSPLYPSNYPNSADVTWTIQSWVDQKIHITFHSFETERGFDYFRAGDGDNNYYNEFFVWHGTKDPPDLISSWNQMWLRFTSDGSATRSGFLLSAVSLPSTVTVGCNSSEFDCGHSVCINGSWRCDYQSDCYDGSDELYCDGQPWITGDPLTTTNPVWPRGPDTLQDFLQYLNKQHTSISFTMEQEQHGTIPFLDVKISRNPDGTLGHSVYRKPTHTDRYLHQRSFHHPSIKSSVNRTLVQRASEVCDQDNLKRELKHYALLRQAGLIGSVPPRWCPVPAAMGHGTSYPPWNTVSGILGGIPPMEGGRGLWNGIAEGE
ncbi:deleted in malignant brain tumors 1 protein-like [Patiria miniata]|uniref:Deleted in malignant brain tumors 1 protein-like n=1 Tax=Patiria miniata TaxID=46514 RepID=A0A913Z4M9_PATMI|nr:deleted in malignant brain tumors 1 protein-like [Patiria miniata]